MQTRMRALAALACAALVMSAIGCGGNDDALPQVVRLTVFGWGPSPDGGAGDEFVPGMPAYEDATEVRVRVTQPSTGVVLERQTTELSSKRAVLPEIEFGEGLRLELEVLNDAGEVLASGATPTFDYGSGDASKIFRVMVSPTNAFAPAGSLVADSETGSRAYAQSRLDYRAISGGASAPWLGRVGHAAAVTSQGMVLIVGGANVVPGTAPGALPKFRDVYSDVQLYDPETGYFTDLSYDDATGGQRPNTQDRLEDARAYHTLTPLGDDRFLVIGGYTSRAELTRPVDTVEIVDLNKPLGQRVEVVLNASGAPLVLGESRGFHRAVYLPQRSQVLVVGGIGATGEDVLTSIELVDADNGVAVNPGVGLAEGRVGHKALLLGDGSIWVMGGRNSTGALKTTEYIEIGSEALNVVPGIEMIEPRYDFAASLIGDASSVRVVVVGGFTDLAGTVTGKYEIGIKGRASFADGNNWTLASPRAELTLVELPQTRDLVVFGGRDASGQTVSRAERLSFAGLAEPVPYEVISDGVGTFMTARLGATTTLMTNGQVLVMGGEGVFQQAQIALDNAEVYNARDPVEARRLP